MGSFHNAIQDHKKKTNCIFRKCVLQKVLNCLLFILTAASSNAMYWIWCIIFFKLPNKMICLLAIYFNVLDHTCQIKGKVEMFWRKFCKIQCQLKKPMAFLGTIHPLQFLSSLSQVGNVKDLLTWIISS